jgi:transposase
MPSPKLAPLLLTDGERAALEALVRKRTMSQSLALRARIVLACAEDGGTSPLTAVAASMDVSREMVRKWRVRFLEGRLKALADAPRPGAPRKITDEQVEVVVTRVLTEKGPGQDSHWSTRSMAGETGLSQSSVSRIWRAFGLKPHVVETWKLSTDPQFIAKVRDVVGLYMNPPEHALVLAVDEKSQIQALDRTAPCLPILPTTPARMTHDYVRHGTTSLFAAYDVGSGSVIAQSCRRHRHQEFLRFLKLTDAAVPRDLDLHLVLDNYATHKDPGHPPVAGEAPPLPPALHPGQLKLAQPRRTLVRRADQPQAPPVGAPQRDRARRRHSQVDQRMEQESQGVRLDQVR